jgi:hypothetical protein
MKTYSLISLLVLLHTFSFSQNKQREFIEALINNSENLEKFIDENELVKSSRLGINYDSVKYKFLISYDIDDKVKEEIKTNGVKYEVKTDELGNGYSMTEFSAPSINYTKQFYFKNRKWISPITYFSKDWITKTSKYFIFKISEPKYFNDYCINKLDEFVDSIAVLLEFDEQQKKLLEKEKIYYVLCKDEKEIEQVTGFNTRGIYITAFDEVVTTYNTHYHELAHLLMNYKLKNLSLYTLPFFMEGFAVAVGGRGGMAKRVVLDIGYYLQKSGFLTYDSIITNEGFYKEDASMTYPVAGLYNAFLLKELGADGYIKLYRGVNGSLTKLEKIGRNQISLPNVGTYDNYLIEYKKKPNIFVDKNDTNKIYFYSEDDKKMRYKAGLFVKIKNYYKFSIHSPFIFSPQKSNLVADSYRSKKYIEISGDTASWKIVLKYGITADSNSISLYNFYSNELIASYSKNFSFDSQTVPVIDNMYEFFINENVFENDLEEHIMIKFK